MNTIKAKAVINSGVIGTADWNNAKTLADSVLAACASYGKDYQFSVALVGERTTIDGNTTDSLEVKSKIKFANGTWSSIQEFEDKIRDACKDNSSLDYEVKTYVDKKVKR